MSDNRKDKTALFDIPRILKSKQKKKQNKTKTDTETEDTLVIARGEDGREKGEKDKGDREIQTPIYNINKSRGYNRQHR